MDFTLPSHVEALREEVRKFAQREIRPQVMTWDEARIFPSEVMKALGDMGMMGVIFPEAYGGAGMGYESNPYRVVRFKNSTPFVLESGPIAIYAGGSFVGEGLSEGPEGQTRSA